jgi:RimJ/RimL family protein N-acetyltransferase
MTRVAKALTDYGFNELKINKVEIRAAVENKNRRGIPERLGFVNEGCIRHAEWLYDHYVDHVVYEIAENTRDFSHEMNRLRIGRGLCHVNYPTYVSPNM